MEHPGFLFILQPQQKQTFMCTGNETPINLPAAPAPDPVSKTRPALTPDEVKELFTYASKKCDTPTEQHDVVRATLLFNFGPVGQERPLIQPGMTLSQMVTIILENFVGRG